MSTSNRICWNRHTQDTIRSKPHIHTTGLHSLSIPWCLRQSKAYTAVRSRKGTALGHQHHQAGMCWRGVLTLVAPGHRLQLMDLRQGTWDVFCALVMKGRWLNTLLRMSSATWAAGGTGNAQAGRCTCVLPMLTRYFSVPLHGLYSSWCPTACDYVDMMIPVSWMPDCCRL